MKFFCKFASKKKTFILNSTGSVFGIWTILLLTGFPSFSPTCGWTTLMSGQQPRNMTTLRQQGELTHKT
jgi:hypothetical protein